MTPPLLLAAREGFHVPGIETFTWPSVIDINLLGIDLSINRTILTVFLGTIIVSLLFAVGFRNPKLVPKGLQNCLEAVVDFVREHIVISAMGKGGLPYLPYLTTLFVFIFTMNIFEVIPGVNFPPTSRFGIPLALAIMSWFLFIHAGSKSQGIGAYFKGQLFPPGVPWPMYALLTPIELVSTFIVRPFSLAVRLTANLIAGHILLMVFFLGTAYLYGSSATFAFGVLSMTMSVVLVGFEVFVCLLQAFVFTMLTAVYIQTSREAHH